MQPQKNPEINSTTKSSTLPETNQMPEENEHPTISLTTLVDQKKVANTLLNDLGALNRFSQKLKLEEPGKLIQEVIDRIQQAAFSIAIVGEFKRGKSTLINALLGQEILPSDILPCSATLNRVTYGVQPRLQLKFRDGQEKEVGINQLTNYVTKLTPESEEAAAEVEEAIVYYPIRHDNVDIIDTPGLNDDTNMTEVTLSVLPKVDAAVMVMMAPAVFSAYERDFLENKLMMNDLGRVIFVVNAIDRCTRPGDKERLLDNAVSRLQKYIFERAAEKFGEDSPEYKEYIKKIGKPKVFGISAEQALFAKLENNDTVVEESGFAAFNEALEEFLTTGRGAVQLQVGANRAVAAGKQILSTITIRENGLAMKQADFDAAYEKSLAEISALREQKKTEMELINKTTQNVRYNVKPLVNQLPDELKQAAERAIDEAIISKGEVKRTKVISERLAKEVSNSVQNAGQRIADKIQTEIQEGLTREIDRLQGFSDLVNKTLSQIEMNFVSVDASADRKVSGGSEAIAAAVSVFTGFGGIWSGYKKAGVKGAAVGAAGSVATAFGGGIALGLLSLPFSWPALLAIGVTSIFTGGWLAEKVFEGDRIESFKANYKEGVLKEIDKQLALNPINQKVETQISQTFESLKQSINQEVEASLDSTQDNLTQISRDRERNITLNAAELSELKNLRMETERIIGNAQRLSDELVEIMSV
jgi:predicted GTPase